MRPSNRLGIVLAALAVATTPLVQEQQKLEPRKPDPPRPPPRRSARGPAPRMRLRQLHDDTKPPGHNGSRAMARRVRQMERAAQKKGNS
jgi:hypothetical protein